MLHREGSPLLLPVGKSENTTTPVVLRSADILVRKVLSFLDFKRFKKAFERSQATFQERPPNRPPISKAGVPSGMAPVLEFRLEDLKDKSV